MTLMKRTCDCDVKYESQCQYADFGPETGKPCICLCHHLPGMYPKRSQMAQVKRKQAGKGKPSKTLKKGLKREIGPFGVIYFNSWKDLVNFLKNEEGKREGR